MAVLGAEFEQRFTEVLTSRAAAVPHGAMGRSIHTRSDVRSRTVGSRPSAIDET
jgi:hypothetical protein